MGGRTELSRSDKRKKPREISSRAREVTIPAVKVNSYPSLTSIAVPRAKISLGRMASPLKRYDEVLGNAKDATATGTRAMTPP